MSGIFISYRRDDTQGEALHLFNDLKEHFGTDQVFMDVAAVRAGTDFRKAIEDAIQASSVLIVMIGKKWLESVENGEQRRLDDPRDFVRMEVGAALRRGISVIPLLVQGAQVPGPGQLPNDLEELVYRNAFDLRLNRWEADVAELVKELKAIIPSAAPSTSAEPLQKRHWWQQIPKFGKAAAGVIAAGVLVAIVVPLTGIFPVGNAVVREGTVPAQSDNSAITSTSPPVQMAGSSQPKASSTSSQSSSKRMNILAAENGGQLLIVPNIEWLKTIDGKEDWCWTEGEAIYAFKDERMVTFDTFTMLIAKTGGDNIKRHYRR